MGHQDECLVPHIGVCDLCGYWKLLVRNVHVGIYDNANHPLYLLCYHGYDHDAEYQSCYSAKGQPRNVIVAVYR